MTKDPYSTAGARVGLVEHESTSRGSQAYEGGRTALTVEQILAWADAFHATHGIWPRVGAGSASRVVAGAPRELWKSINQALASGLRGLPGNSSLAELLAEHRGVPMPERPPKVVAEKTWSLETKPSPVKGPQIRPREARERPVDLTIAGILAWADAHHAAHGQWPRSESIPVEAVPNESWTGIDYALRIGRRGLPGGSSLCRLLVEHHGPEADHRLPRLTVGQILGWADAHLAATGKWPISAPVAVAASPGDTWDKIDQALRCGDRGLAGGTTLARVLARHRGLGEPCAVPGLTVEGILDWADDHHAATRKWPRKGSGPVRNRPHELTWKVINEALRVGQHGLPGGTSLARLLAEHREVRAPLTVERILAWADAHHADQGEWPCAQHKPVAAARGETWRGIDKALKLGSRGLPGGSSLTGLLVEHRGPEASEQPPRLTLGKILAWADAHHEATGRWPISAPSPVAEAPGETWETIERALRQGLRGLKGGASLESLLARRRGPRHRRNIPRLTVDQILAWADAHHASTGRWPWQRSGPIAGATGETWMAIQKALYEGHRGLPGGMTLSQLLADRREPRRKPPLTVEKILAWAEGHHQARGFWPNRHSGPVAGVPGERWENINLALRRGMRGLPGGMTLAEVLRPLKNSITLKTGGQTGP